MVLNPTLSSHGADFYVYELLLVVFCTISVALFCAVFFIKVFKKVPAHLDTPPKTRVTMVTWPGTVLSFQLLVLRNLLGPSGPLRGIKTWYPVVCRKKTVEDKSSKLEKKCHLALLSVEPDWRSICGTKCRAPFWASSPTLRRSSPGF